MVTEEQVKKYIEECDTLEEAINILRNVVDLKTNGLFGQNDCYLKRHYTLSKNKDKVVVVDEVDLVPPRVVKISQDKNLCRIHPSYFYGSTGDDRIQTTVRMHQLKTSWRYREIHLTDFQGYIGFTDSVIEKIGFDPMEKISSLEEDRDKKRSQCGKLRILVKSEQEVNTELRRENRELLERIDYLQKPWFDKLAMGLKAKVKGAIRFILKKREER